ncbi:MAG: hypothetical protein GC204_00280 [Chloroflexi bacterium]|nr:hypothetical protein [Chloroflexota bacterium]
MSVFFDLVIMCDLREDTPEACIRLIQWLADPASDPATRPPFDCSHAYDPGLNALFNYPFLAQQADEEVASRFQNRFRHNTEAGEVYRYRLQFSQRNIMDDDFDQALMPFVDWLTGIAEDGFIGYYRNEDSLRPTLLYVKDRNLEIRD